MSEEAKVTAAEGCLIPRPHGNIDAQCATKDYNLRGPQVDSGASYWASCDEPIVKVLTLKRIQTIPFPKFTNNAAHGNRTLQQEMNELVYLSERRDDPDSISGSFQGAVRRPISKFVNFLEFRPPPLGAVAVARNNALNGIREDLIRTGRGLARYFESETPGLAHRQALNGLIRRRSWSPPRQALVWTALDAAISSALLAAWYHKWLNPDAEVSRRPRPIECYSQLNVLFDCPDELNPNRPECPPPGPQHHSGTPRHPSYPSGHSTYAGAASELLAFFFPQERTELWRLADNAGMARLWAGIHWRRDHEQGLELGRRVAKLIIADLVASGIPFPPPALGGCNPNAPVPTRQSLKNDADLFESQCPTRTAVQALDEKAMTEAGEAASAFEGDAGGAPTADEVQRAQSVQQGATDSQPLG
jgi:hypothetical protein